uniref:Rho guanine nucleotide exchange factor 15 isoform X2 n=1 Tax=Geotrypetes seraphini TaxID=260995 RepID=A0A6P8Q0P1_GEOSA|nr:rho guanine nucleotide exchange factor 15 isoform X2 [Geotrypetes seraphini]
MSSTQSLPPLAPLTQKPTRFIKARPPLRQRPYLPPRPDPAKLTPPASTVLATAPVETVKKVLVSLNETEAPADDAGTTQPAEERPCSWQKMGNVKKIAGRFDHGKIPLHPPSKPARVFRKSSDVGMTPIRTSRAVSKSEEALIPATVDQEDGLDIGKESWHPADGVSQYGLETDEMPTKHMGHSEGERAVMEPESDCRAACPCICHTRRPGMVLVWVPAPTPAREGAVTPSGSSLSSSSDSLSFQHSFAVGEEVAHGRSEDVNGNLARGSAPDSKSDLPKASKPWANKSKSYPVQRRSLRGAADAGAGSFKNEGVSSSPPADTGVILTSYKSMAEGSLGGDELFESGVDCNGRGADALVSGERAVKGSSVPKPPRRNKICSQASTEMEEADEQPPAVPPKAPKKPPRAALAPLLFFRKGSLRREEGRKALEGEEWLGSGGGARRLSAHATCVDPLSYTPLTQEERRERGAAEEESSKAANDLSPSKEMALDLDAEHSGERSASITSPKLIDWESRLQDEPLYQTYRLTVIRKEIKRQTVPRNNSTTSFDCPSGSPPSLSEYGGGSPRQSRRSVTPQNTLWQELPVVRESGILEKMSTEQRKMQESMFEVLTSEASYLRSLTLLIEHFMNSRELDETLIIREKKILFSNILKVKEISERFLKDLEERVDESLEISDVCDIIHHHAQHNFQVYKDYVRNQVYQEKTYSSLMERNVHFATVITRLQELPQCQRLPFMSFLLLPFQRITRIKMLIENILKQTKEGSRIEQNAMKALTSVSKIIEDCNSEVGRMKQTEELIHINQKIEFDKLKAVPIISQTRYLEKQGELSEVIQKGSLFGIKPRFTPVYFFLFNDFLLITHRKSSEKYVVVDYAHRSLVQVEGHGECSHGAGVENGFFLTLLENHQGKMCERLFKAPSQSDMHRWIAAFPKHKEQAHSNTDTIYEDWDCLQVQCVEPYVAVQADELSLEPTDIINVLRKTTEGWYEGIRLSDGLKGWFPSKYVQEITNEHVRRRNLRERYRVMQVARQIQVTRTASIKKYSSA